MRSIPGTITSYTRDRDQVEELDLSPAEKHALRRTKAQERALEAERLADEARAAVAVYDQP